MKLGVLKTLTLTISVFTIWMLLFGFFEFGMEMNMDSPTANCPFGGHSMSICKMNPMEHIQEWQSMFTTLSTKDALAFIFVLFFILTLLKFRYRFSLSLLPQLNHTRPFYVNRILISSPLEEAFSNGILNPKVF